MSKIIEPLRGVHDVLPAQAPAWQHLERITREVFAAYGYEEFRVPIIEQTQLFKRSIGDFTDIVEKEMFSFVDQGEDHITLRPEATAGIVRAVISNGLLREGRLRVWCMGPMFRRERPQAGRYRQFHQIDAEAFGFEGPDIDAEMILLSARLLRRLGLTRLKLLVNSLGTPAARAAYRERLTAYFGAHEAALDEDSKRRLHGNPLRILDSKNPRDAAPHRGGARAARCARRRVAARISSACARTLRSAGIEYHVEPRLVRGLDYYTRTVFEWTTDALGAQSTVCAGGRYDGLVAQLGGAATPGSAGRWGRSASSCCWRSKLGVGCASGRRFIWCWRGARRAGKDSSWRSGCARRGRICGCRSTWAAAASRRSSSGPTRAAPSLRWFSGRMSSPAASSRSRVAPGAGAGRVPDRRDQ